jgi:hypothetical protein
VEGLLVALVVSVPTLTIEEDWHGRPMIDQPGHLWIVAAVVAALGFVLGGAVGARRSTVLWRAVSVGAIVGAAVSAVLLLADVVRRSVSHQALSSAVVRLWVGAALISIVIASLGGAFAYFRSTVRR